MMHPAMSGFRALLIYIGIGFLVLAFHSGPHIDIQSAWTYAIILAWPVALLVWIFLAVWWIALMSIGVLILLVFVLIMLSENETYQDWKARRNSERVERNMERKRERDRKNERRFRP